MSKYTAEQVEVVAGIHEDVRFADEKNRDKLADKTSAMLRDYAALLRERESAKLGVTDEIARLACKAFNDQSMQFNDAQYVCMRAALEAVAPMLANSAERHLEQEQDDIDKIIDKILVKLDFTVERARTELFPSKNLER